MTAPARVSTPAVDGTRGSAELIRAEAPVLAHNYHPLPVVVARAEGAWVEDVEGGVTSTCWPATPPSTSVTAIRC